MVRVSTMVKIFVTAMFMSASILPSYDGLLSGAAFAKSEKAKEKSSKSSDKSSKKKSSAKSKSKKTSSATSSNRVVKKPKKKPRKTVAIASVPAASSVEETYGGLPKKKINAALGALNAAHASEQAFQNASPNSRVGRIAAYRDQVLENEMLRAELKDATVLLDTMDAPDLTAEEFAALLATEAAKRDALETEIAVIRTALNALGGENEELETALIAAEMAQAEQDKIIAELDVQSANANAYWDGQVALSERQAELDELDRIASELLAAAANKPITDGVVLEVHRLLELPAPETDEEELAEASE